MKLTIKGGISLIFISSLILFTSCNDSDYLIQQTNIPHAEVYNFTQGGSELIIDNVNTWYGFTDLEIGEELGFAINNEGFTPYTEGIYKVDYAVSFSGSGGSTHAISLLINGIEHPSCRIYRKLGTAGDVGNAGGTCLITLQAGDIVTGAVMDVSPPAQNVDIWSVNANLVRIGGSS